MFDVNHFVQPLYRTLADLCRAIRECNDSWVATHEDSIEYLEDYYLPRGSGIDGGCSVSVDESGHDRLVLDVSYHCPDGLGGYRGWWEVLATITPSLGVIEFDIDLELEDGDVDDPDCPMGERDMYYIETSLSDALNARAPRYVHNWLDMADFCGTGASKELIAVACAAEPGAEVIQDKMAEYLATDDGDNDTCTTISPVIRESSGPDMYEWIWSVGPAGKEWGVDVKIEVLYIDPDKVNTDSLDEPYISFTMEASTPGDGLIRRIGPDTMKTLSPVIIHDDYQLQRMWERMEQEVGPLTEDIVEYIHNRLEDEDNAQ